MKLSIEEQEKRLAQRLREERESRNISQLDLALKANLSQNIVAMIETNRRVPNLSTIFKLCDALDINPAVLFERTSEEKQIAKAQIISILNRCL